MKFTNCLFRAFALQSFIFVFMMSCNSNKANPGNRTGLPDTLRSNEAVNPYVSADRSQMDMSYYPNDYPVLKMNGTDSVSLVARVIYSRPQKKGRTIFGNTSASLCEYGKEWRLGANEATELEFFEDVIIHGQRIDKGTYIIYCIPYQEKWTIILNTNLYTWGLHIDKAKDIFKIDVSAELQVPSLEDFTMVFEKANYGVDLIMAWDKVKATLPIRTTK
ncbi:MAG: DUF2911 domain-containing protein [Ferruginibacter sp.]